MMPWRLMKMVEMLAIYMRKLSSKLIDMYLNIDESLDCLKCGKSSGNLSCSNHVSANSSIKMEVLRIFRQAMFNGCPIHVGSAAQVWWLDYHFPRLADFVSHTPHFIYTPKRVTYRIFLRVSTSKTTSTWWFWSGGFTPSEKYESIGMMIIPNWMGKSKPCSKPPTSHQIPI